MICLKCNEVIPDGSSYCPKCGDKISNLLGAEDQEKLEICESFKKSKFSKVILVFVFLSLFVLVSAFVLGLRVIGMIALVQTVSFLMSWLMGTGRMKSATKYYYRVLAVMGFLCIILLVLSFVFLV